MKFSVIAASELDVGLKSRWDDLRSHNAVYASPYFTWQYLDALTAVGRDVKVLVVEERNQVLGMMGFEKQGAARLVPAGHKLNDYQGMVADPQMDVGPQALLKACGAQFFHFDHIPANLRTWTSCSHRRHISPAMDLQGGWDAYVARLATAQGKNVPGILARVRQAKKTALKTLGAVQLEFHQTDHALLETLMAWKSRQYRSTPGADDSFAQPWIRKLLHHLLDQQHPQLKGVLTSVKVDNTLLACHFGIQSGGVLHAWFPVYSVDHAALSPGLVMFHDMGQQAQENNVTTLDFGRGAQDYKLRFMTSHTELAEGIATRPQWLGNGMMFGQQLNQHIRSRLKQNPLSRRIHQQVKNWGNRT